MAGGRTGPRLRPPGLWQLAILGAVLALAVLIIIGKMQKLIDIGDADEKPVADKAKAASKD